ncbi:MAG: hypothetical protein AAGA38_16040, partial [Pseudomonadota bacterium]
MTSNAPAHVIISGTPEGFDAQVLGQELDRAEAPVIFVARDDKRLAAMAQALEVTRPELPRLAFPAWDCLPY